MSSWRDLPYLDYFQKHIEKYKRTWKERLLSWPWKPWEKYGEKEYFYWIDVSKKR